MDTDSIIKMGRYSLLNDFESIAIQSGHPKPFRRLYEIEGKLRAARLDPVRSEFRTSIAMNMCWSFVADCRGLSKAEDVDVFEELREIEGMDQGEALLVEYALRETNAIIVTGDKRMIRGLLSTDATKFRKALQQRILHLDRIIWTLGTGPKWAGLRQKLDSIPDCDDAIYNAVRLPQTDSDAQARMYKMMTDFERSSLGLVRSAI